MTDGVLAPGAVIVAYFGAPWVLVRAAKEKMCFACHAPIGVGQPAYRPLRERAPQVLRCHRLCQPCAPTHKLSDAADPAAVAP